MSSIAPLAAPGPEALRERLRTLSGDAGAMRDAEGAPVPEALRGVFPSGLRPGGVYRVEGSTTVLLALLAASSAAGAWCGVVGVPELGLEAAAEHGVVLERLVLVPRPGPRWLAALAALGDVMGIVAARPGSPVSEAEASRFAARLRRRGVCALVLGPWPGAEATLRVAGDDWSGLGRGRGELAARTLRIAVEGRRVPQGASAVLRLGGPVSRSGPRPVSRAAGAEPEPAGRAG